MLLIYDLIFPGHGIVLGILLIKTGKEISSEGLRIKTEKYRQRIRKGKATKQTNLAVLLLKRSFLYFCYNMGQSQMILSLKPQEMFISTIV